MLDLWKCDVTSMHAFVGTYNIGGILTMMAHRPIQEVRVGDDSWIVGEARCRFHQVLGGLGHGGGLTGCMHRGVCSGACGTRDNRGRMGGLVGRHRGVCRSCNIV